jgi:hypothetical protein
MHCLNALGSVKKEHITLWRVAAGFLNNILFYKDKACSFFTNPYKCVCMMASLIMHAAIKSKKFPDTSIIYA